MERGTAVRRYGWRKEGKKSSKGRGTPASRTPEAYCTTPKLSKEDVGNPAQGVVLLLRGEKKLQKEKKGYLLGKKLRILFVKTIALKEGKGFKKGYIAKKGLR